MEKYIHFLIVFPWILFIVGLALFGKNEKRTALISLVGIGIHFFVFLVFTLFWFVYHKQAINIEEFSIFKSLDYNFFIDFYCDKTTLVFGLLGAMLTFLIVSYSRYYLHREAGFNRFFTVILFFYAGFNWVIFSGNFETLFIGWETLGISSFLLIAFYQKRYLPVKNALKVFSIYRIGDVGLILAMWLSHHFWHENISFFKLNSAELVHEHLMTNSIMGFSIALLIYVSAIAKSAQLPVSSWLPRAMEGPTPSTAVFYGSLSVHMGAFLLIRTFPFWEFQTEFRVMVVVFGIVTSIVATWIARVQSTVKSQIAYSSIAQIGLIFAEIGMGWIDFALLHIVGNAFLRTYQLLVSPSIVSYKIKQQMYLFVPRVPRMENRFSTQFKSSLYVLSLKEFQMDQLMQSWVWNPVKLIGNKIPFLTSSKIVYFGIPIFVIAVILLTFVDFINPVLRFYLPGAIAFLALLFVLKSFSERKNVFRAWYLVAMNPIFIALSISFNDTFNLVHVTWYLSGVLVAFFIGFAVLRRLKKKQPTLDLNQFQGYIQHYPKEARIFLIATLALSGFPITPTFIGQDLIFTHIQYSQVFLAVFVAISFIINGIALMRIYARVFLGPSIKNPFYQSKRSA